MDSTWTAFLRDLEQVRAATPRLADVELRASDDDGDETLGTMTGHFSVFDTWYEIDSFFEGNFLERIAPGAFRKTMAESRDTVKVLFNHGHDRLGNMALGVPTELREDDVGAFYEVPLFDTSYNRDLQPGLRAGAYGASFRFRTIQDQWNEEPGTSDHNPSGIPERTITEVRLFEFGPVTFPANPAATAGMRSLTDRYYEHLRTEDPQRYDQLLTRAREIRTPTPPAALPEGTDGQGAAQHDTDEPPSGTRSGPTHGERERVLRELTFGRSER